MSAAVPVTSPESKSGSDALASLTVRLAAADRILQKERGAILLLRMWPWVTGFVAAAFAADVVLHLASIPRLAISIAFAMLIVGALAWCAWLAWGRRNSFEHVARVLEARHARLGSKMINILQLRAQTEDRSLAPLTRELARAAIAGYAEELQPEPIEQLARTNEVREHAKEAALGLVCFAALLALLGDITRTEAPRFLDPFGDHPPYSFTRLEITDPAHDGVEVVYNSSLLVTAKSSGHRPAELYLSWFPAGHPEQTATLPMFDRGERGFTQQIESVKTDVVVFAHTKNQHAISRQRHVGVILTPRLDHALVKITPPTYTQLPPTEKGFDFKNVKALEGSTVEFRLASNRPLASGSLTVTTENAPETVAMKPIDEKTVAGSFVAKEPAALKFALLDRDGFPSQDKWEASLTVTHDLPPDVQVTNPGTDSFVAMDFKAEPAVEAIDDYGLKTVRIHTGINGTYGDPRVVNYDKITLHDRQVVPLEFSAMGLKSGDTVSVFAEAIDNCPTPHLARSKTVTFTVISTEEYNNFLRERTDISDIEAKYAKLVNDMRDLAAQQKKLGEQSDALKQQLAAAKTDAEKVTLQKKLNDLMAQQKALNSKLNDLADKMEHFVRKEPLYDVEADLQETLAQKAQEIRDSAKANEEAMNQVKSEAAPSAPTKSGQSAPSQKMLEDFKHASDEQLERLGATAQETEDEVTKPLEDLSLMQEIIKDINHFKDLYAAQQELASQAQAYKRPGPLGREDQLALKDLAAQEKALGDELDALEQKFWEDGKAAQEKFPKAGKSAQDIAQRMGDLKLQTLANQATSAMVNGQGNTGAQLAENLRGEMEKLFTECCKKPGQMDGELDQYLSIQRGLKPGMNFKEMMQCHKFGSGFKPGGMGQGYGGKDGYAIIAGQNPNVLGNEALPSASDKADTDGNGKNKASPDGAKAKVALDKGDVVHGVNPLNRESEAVQGETIIQKYDGLVEQYFKALTKDPKKATKP